MDDSASTPLLEDVPVSDADILRRVAAVSLPAYPMNLVRLCSGFVSVALVGRYGSVQELAAIGLAGLITNVTGYSWLAGMSVAIQQKSSQDWGGENFHAVGVTLQRGYYILLCSCVPLLCCWLNAASILRALGQDPHVSDLVAEYAAVRCPSLLASSLKIVIERTFFSIGKPRVLLKLAFFITALNVFLSTRLIPRIGFIGAPLTLLICDIVDMTCALVIASRDPDMRRCWPGFRREAFRGWGEFLRISLPSFVLLAIDLWSWDLMGFLAGLLSQTALATQAVVPRLALLQYTVGAALRQGVLTCVGNLLGEGRPSAARRVAQLVAPLTMVVMLLQVWLLYTFRVSIGQQFTGDPVVLASILDMMPLCFLFSVFDGLQTALTGVVNATGKQWIVAPLVLLLYWVVGFPAGAYLAFKQHWGLQGLWTGYTAAVVAQAGAYLIMLRCIDWSKLGQDVLERIALETSHTSPKSP